MPPEEPIQLLDRDLSILSFNERVLALAEREDYPLIERLRFICIVASNVDEFFEVRSAPYVNAKRDPSQQEQKNIAIYHALSDKAHQLVDRQYAVLNQTIMPALARQGIQLLSNAERNEQQKRWVARYFEENVKPLLVPVALDPSHPFPTVSNKSLNFIVSLAGVDAFGRNNNVAILKVPRVLPRLIELPKHLSNRQQKFVSLSSVIRAHLSSLFSDRQILSFSQFRVTRHSDLSVDEEDVKNLRTALRMGLVQRNFGEAVRLEVSSHCDEKLANFLLEQFDLPSDSLYRVKGLVNLGRLMQLANMVNRADLNFKPFEPGMSADYAPNVSLFTQLKHQNILIHQPYESFELVIELLREAVYDDNVLSIQQTIYRTGSDPRMMELLKEAVRRGKEVLAVIELKARFDEEANINWSVSLESVGVQVVYGIVGLKTHAKMLLVMRRENERIHYYGHLSTGNYNPKTTRLYTDVSMLTADPELTQDMAHLFRHIASQVKLPSLKKLLVSPFNLHRHMMAHIKVATNAAKNQKPAFIIIKTNALTDIDLVNALIKAGCAGVEIELIVRGACMLPVDAPGLEGRIRVRSVIGRLLEHSRVFYFNINGEEKMWLSSADWMNRNMMRRIETAWPIEDADHRQRILNECCECYLEDNQDAWLLQEQGEYIQHRVTGDNQISAQLKLLAKYAS